MLSGYVEVVAGASAPAHLQQTRTRPPDIPSECEWHGRLAMKMRMPYDSISTGGILALFCQGTTRAYPRYIVTLHPKAVAATKTHRPPLLQTRARLATQTMSSVQPRSKPIPAEGLLRAGAALAFLCAFWTAVSRPHGA